MRELLPWRVGSCFLWGYSSCSVLFLLVRSINTSIFDLELPAALSFSDVFATFLQRFRWRVKINQQLHAYRAQHCRPQESATASCRTVQDRALFPVHSPQPESIWKRPHHNYRRLLNLVFVLRWFKVVLAFSICFMLRLEERIYFLEYFFEQYSSFW